MFFIKLKRVIKAGWINFWRNGYVSLASIVVMSITLLVIGAIVLVGAMLDSTLTNIRNKVDITVYFVTTAPESQIKNLKAQLEALPEVASVDYVSSDQALENFKIVHAGDQHTLQALDELDTNPLGAELTITAKETSQYASISQYLTNDGDSLSSNGASIVDKVSYDEHKDAIDTLSDIINSSKTLGLALSIFFAAISILITFNTIGLVIYMSREEISVMRLVGASNRYVRGPFVFEGLLYGLISTIAALVLLYPITYWVGPISVSLGTGLNLFSYYLSNIFQIGFIMLLASLFIGAFSSYLAVRKYLKV